MAFPLSHGKEHNFRASYVATSIRKMQKVSLASRHILYIVSRPRFLFYLCVNEGLAWASSLTGVAVTYIHATPIYYGQPRSLNSEISNLLFLSLSSLVTTAVFLVTRAAILAANCFPTVGVITGDIEGCRWRNLCGKGITRMLHVGAPRTRM